MARMIPPYIDPDCKSPGEREIFSRLKNDTGTSGWYVLHSLDVANHVTKIAGEIDFLVIIPYKGILCVEVKACSQLRRDNGLWYYGSDPHPDARGPFKQAAEAMHSLRTRLASERPDLAHILFWSAVVFPYVEFSAASGEWHTWQVVDSSKFRSRPFSTLLMEIVERARVFIKKRSGNWFRNDSSGPSPEQCELIANIIRPEFEYYESPKIRGKRLTEEIKQYTSEQYNALDAMESNPRVIFRGPAGTGKTILAIESTRRAAIEGRRTLLLCFNRMLGKWLEDQTSNLKTSIVTKTLHSHMLSVSGIQLKGSEPASFWREELPLLAIEKMLECAHQSNYLFDDIVVDEAQDILFNELYLDFLDLSLNGGLASGRWKFFADFEKQTIFDKPAIDLNEIVSQRAGNVPVYSLRINCRNTPRIASIAHFLGGLDPDYSKILRPDDGIEPELRYYNNDTEQQDLLINALKQLYSRGFRGDDIVILSIKADDNSAASRVKISPWKERICPLRNLKKGHIGYCTIQAFKGLEKVAVIITDVDNVAGLEAGNIFYIGVTRALQNLEILVNGRVRTEVINTLLNQKSN